LRDRQAAGRGQRRIFTKRVAGDKGRVPPYGKTGFSLKHPQGRNRNGHQRRLGVFGELEGFGRAIPDGGRQLLPKRCIDLVEHGARHREGVGQRLAHANRLGPLPRKCECCRHRRSLLVEHDPCENRQPNTRGLGPWFRIVPQRGP